MILTSPLNLAKNKYDTERGNMKSKTPLINEEAQMSERNERIKDGSAKANLASKNGRDSTEKETILGKCV